MGFRISGLRAVTLGAIVAIAGISVPAALSAAQPSQPTTIRSAAFAPVVIPRSAAASATPVVDGRLPSSERTDPTTTAAPRAGAAAAKATRDVVRTRPAPRARAAAAVVVRVVAKRSRPTVATGPVSGVRARIVQVALAQVGDRYVSGGTGPDSFDCSGLVRYAYQVAGAGGSLGGGHSASAMLAWGRRHGLTSRSSGRVGDVVIYGNGSHAGIYIGNGRIVSALNPSQGIRVTGLNALGAPFTTFIHTRT